MPEAVDGYDNTYTHFSERVLDAVRKETFGQDIGQNSWTTAEEYERWISLLALAPGQRVLEVASGSGGPARHLALASGCHVTGIDNNANAVATATRLAAESGVAGRVRFQVADAGARLEFEPSEFDALICIDALNHLPKRFEVLREWRRVLRPGGRALFTDPVVISGPVTNDELALRSSIGFFLFVPPGTNERLIEEAGLRLVQTLDVSANAALVADRWQRARVAHAEELLEIEGQQRFDGLQRFLASVHALTRERRLSRIAYVAEKPAHGASEAAT